MPMTAAIRRPTDAEDRSAPRADGPCAETRGRNAGVRYAEIDLPPGATASLATRAVPLSAVVEAILTRLEAQRATRSARRPDRGPPPPSHRGGAPC